MYPHSWSVCYSHLDYPAPASETSGGPGGIQKGIGQVKDEDVPRRTYGGALTGSGRDYVLRNLEAMNYDGLHWLTPILERMVEGDPWQEGRAALDIMEAWVMRNNTE